MSYLGNHMLNAADFHSSDRGFGMKYLNTVNKTWVLSRLTIEMQEMPEQYARFSVETWVESCMRYFTNRNFCVIDDDGLVLGYGRSVWAMIDTETRQPADILSVNDGAIMEWIVNSRDCPIEKSSRVKMSDRVRMVCQIGMNYSDIDINGHVNSVKYLEHVFNLWDVDWYKHHHIRRFEIAYVAEAHCHDTLSLFIEDVSPLEYCVRIQKDDSTEVARCKVCFEAYF